MTEDDLLLALENAIVENVSERDGFRTFEELQDKTDCPRNKLYRRLGALKDQGLLEVDKIYKENLAGDMRATPVYRLKNGHKA